MLVLLFIASSVPPVSAVLFIIGAGIWILSLLLRAADKPLSFDGVSIGQGLMILGIGLQVIFGV